MSPPNAESQLHRRAARALAETEIEAKLALTEELWTDFQAGRLHATPTKAITGENLIAGWPDRPVIAKVRDLPQRRAHSSEGRAALLHAITHIEFSAINLALDHLARFPFMPEAYHADWLQVAAEEVAHFRLLRAHLRRLGHDYGDFAAHRSLWRMAERTADNVLVRMALVPRLLEARGLDATPPIQAALAAAGDIDSAELLNTILRDEIGHVARGDRWFRALCQERGLPAEVTYRRLLDEYRAPWPSLPMNEGARLAAGFSAEELAALKQRT